MADYTFIFTGASATNSPWPSWKDFVVTRYGLDNVVENAYRGVGNEFMIDSTIHQCKKVKNPFVMIMMTMVDKWDWYVEDAELAAKISREEKHPLRDLNGDQSPSGFWSTGSWFPEYKADYKKLYYSEKYFTASTLKNLFLLQSYLKQNNIPSIILFDSPVLECNEQELNFGKFLQRDLVANNQLAKVWYDLIDWSDIDTSGLIGYCINNKLDWFNDKYKMHPPSVSHLEYCKAVVFPKLDQHFKVVDDDQDYVAQKFQKLFHS